MNPDTPPCHHCFDFADIAGRCRHCGLPASGAFPLDADEIDLLTAWTRCPYSNDEPCDPPILIDDSTQRIPR